MATNDSIRLSSDTSKTASDKGKQYAEKGPAMGYARETREWFAQKYYTRPALNIAFESAQLTYSDLPVDLYNTGVNQILSVAAGRGHRLFHFPMKDLFWDGNLPAALMSVLALDPSWSRENQGSLLEAYRHLRVVDRRVVPLKSIQLFVVRGDDIRTEQSENLSVLRWASENMKMIESVEATLATTDKYGTIRRAPQLPHPVTFAADNLENALDAIPRLPRADGSFVLKDRYGYGCGAQVHRLKFDAPGLEQRLSGYIETYGNILLQEYCPEIEHGDIVVTFFDDELIGALRRLPEPGQWKTNASLGAKEVGCNLTARQESIARALKRSFPECRLVSVDLLESGKILEINAFPGGRGLLKNYGIALGEIVMDRLERELMGKGAELSAPSALSWSGAEKSFPTGTHWPDIEALYSVQQGTREVFDVLSGDRYHLDIRDLIRFEARSPEYILSIPHAGVFVPESHRNRFRLNEKSLIEIDLYSDLLYETSEGLQVHSELAPFFVDMNREREGSKEENLPCHLTNPALEYYDINDRLILERPYMPKDRENVLAYYDLYHDLLAALIERMKRERGYALLFDCHSMTAVGQGRARDKGQSRANFVVGTLAGSSAHQRIIETFSSTLEQQIRPHGLGLSVARDVPYAGGFITRKHHNPRKHVHVIQIEVSMDTYMYEAIVDEYKRYALKKPRLRIVRNAVRNAFRAACEAAECIYRKEETSSDANA
jgi:N-formylglutamate amidohydrolase/glutathione synthase/RimK-type ligase-like ATP-grasp enzyme